MKKTLLLLLTIMALGCDSSESDNMPDPETMNLVTGVTFRQNFDDAPLQLGNPNVRVGNSFVVYPNPAIQDISIMAQQNITGVWIVPANPRKIYQDFDFTTVLNSQTYTESAISSSSVLSFSDQPAANLSLNIGSLDDGYYRIFVKIEGQIYWDNLYKRSDSENPEEEMATIVSFWD